MAKKLKKSQKNTKTPNDNTAFSKEAWYGSSRKSRNKKNNKKKRGETYHPNGPANKIVLSVDEVVDSMIEKYHQMHPELDDNS